MQHEPSGVASTLNEVVAVNLGMHLSHLWPFCELKPCVQLDVDLKKSSASDNDSMHCQIIFLSHACNA